MSYQILHGNNLDILPTLADSSIDAIVTDPPYELGFMGKKWDSSGIAYNVELWRECLRVLKPGGHLLSFGGTRTWHRIAVAIEDAGFEVRDSIAWMYGSGFPKSLDISKAIDKAAGAEREIVGSKLGLPGYSLTDGKGGLYGGGFGANGKGEGECRITAPSTPEAQQWQGWGTALKPAFEPVIVARKPLIGTVAANVLEHGTGGLNIDGSRIGTGDDRASGGLSGGATDNNLYQHGTHGRVERATGGRWPSNVILGHTELCQPTGKTIKNKTIAGKRTATFGTQETQSGGDGSGGWSGYEYETEVYECADGCPVKLLDEQSGQSKSATEVHHHTAKSEGYNYANKTVQAYGDKGGASRFFYVAKASKRDRNEGLDELPLRKSDQRSDVAAGLWAEMEAPKQNFHPTVKPTTLMRYLVKLVTPPGGVVLDPFTGSGSTGKAAILEGFDFIGIEMTDEYLPIIEGRLKHAEKLAAEEKEKKDEALF